MSNTLPANINNFFPVVTQPKGVSTPVPDFIPNFIPIVENIPSEIANAALYFKPLITTAVDAVDTTINQAVSYVFNPNIGLKLLDLPQELIDNIFSNGSPTFKPNPVLENLQIGLEQRSLNAYKDLIPHYFNPKNVPSISYDGSLDSWQDINPLQMNLYSNGKPVLGTIKFNAKNDQGQDYTLINFNGVQYDTANNPNPHPTLTDFFLDNVIISVKQKKYIVTTGIMGRNGMIKEYVGLDDYDVKLEGTLVGPNGIYPLEDATMLSNYLKLPASIYITCPYLNNLFGIDYLTIMDFNIDQEKGGVSYQKYTIECSSDNLTDTNIMASPYSSK
jgi:hypothetical protein